MAVVVVSRNRAKELRESLPRHLALPEGPRVVLVDDASSDGTAEMVRRRFPDVELITLPTARGAVARNAGLLAVGEPYVALVDDDAWFEPGALAGAVAMLARHSRLALINAHILVGPDRRLDPVCEEMAASPLPAADGQPGHPLLSFIGCAVVVRRQAILDVGGFHERLQTGGEEKLLGWDLAAAGWQMSYVPEVVARHCPPRNDGRSERRAQALRNELWIQWLRRPAPAALRFTLRALSRLPKDATTLRGFARAVCGGRWVLRERRASPPHVQQMISLLEHRGAQSP